MLEVAPNTYYKDSDYNCREGREIRIGDKLEFEVSQFLDPSYLERGRANYYGTTYLYIVGEGSFPGTLPTTKCSDRGITCSVIQSQLLKVPDSVGTPHCTLPAVQSMMVISDRWPPTWPRKTGSLFVRGRRVHHSSALDGQHDEFYENGILQALVGTAGPRFINQSCSSCHVRNGRAAVAAIGEPLTQWVVKVGDSEGNAHPMLGHTLQPQTSADVASEGSVSIAYYPRRGWSCHAIL